MGPFKPVGKHEMDRQSHRQLILVLQRFIVEFLNNLLSMFVVVDDIKDINSKR
jgi:hypothetical protein